MYAFCFMNVLAWEPGFAWRSNKFFKTNNIPEILPSLQSEFEANQSRGSHVKQTEDFTLYTGGPNKFTAAPQTF